MEKEESARLLEMLKKAEQLMGTLEGGKATPAEVLPKVVQLLQRFRAESQELGLKGLVQAAQQLERTARKPSLGPEDLTMLTFALSTLRGGVQDGSPEGVRSAMIEMLELLGVEPMEVSLPQDLDEKARPKKKTEASWMPQEQVVKPVEDKKEAVIEPVSREPTPEPSPMPKVSEPGPRPPAPPPAVEAQEGEINLDSIAERLGGKLIMPEEGSGEPVKLEIPPDSLDKVRLLLSPFDPSASLADRLPSPDERLREVIDSVKEFMASFAEGNLERAQEVLEHLSEFQGEGELFAEIGGIARTLHDSVADFARSLDPELKDLVEDKIPDTGNRLEHIMQLTEDAATTTLDHAESIRSRMREDQERVQRLRHHLARLMPIGDVACGRMDESVQLLRDIECSLNESQEDVGTILTSQGYQDLTGQIIAKVVTFQKDLEGKLIGLIKTFGVKVSKSKQKKDEELYGPAHEKMGGALHSQDEVDAILAQFGF